MKQNLTLEHVDFRKEVNRHFSISGNEFDPNVCRYLIKSQQLYHAINEQEKKRSYNERALHFDHRTFTPLVFSVYGSMERECNTFYSRLSQLISDHRNLSETINMNWIRTKVCSTLLKQSLICLRGCRTVCRQVLHRTLMFHKNMPKSELNNSNFCIFV